VRKAVLLVVVALVAIAYPAVTLAGSHGNGHAAVCVFKTHLAAANEVQGSTSTATGRTKLTIREDGTIEFKTKLDNPAAETFTFGHIHFAPAGVNGPVAQGLFSGPPTSDTKIKQRGEVSNPTLATALCANPSAYYVNYHTTGNPGGAIRGQLG
jgi:hypothetical protein